VLISVALFLVAAIGWPTGFILSQCRGNGLQTPPDLPAALRDRAGYRRAESFTFLTLPEWSIVYSADEYARFIERGRPSRFPHFAAIGQYWRGYSDVCAVTRREYPFESGYQVMLGVIGVSFSLEHAVKGVWEKTIGRFTEHFWTRDTPEDAFAAKTAREYGTFMHTTPWYEFPFGARLGALWRQTPAWGPHPVRKWERRAVLSAEYGLKAVYGAVIGLATGAAYAPEDLQIQAWVDRLPPKAAQVPGVAVADTLADGSVVITLPRYEAFTRTALALHAFGVRWRNIAGNDEILITAIAPAGSNPTIAPARVVSDQRILTNAGARRVAMRVPVASLHAVLAALQTAGATIEHLYDY
jgi:hypothetical protein